MTLIPYLHVWVPDSFCGARGSVHAPHGQRYPPHHRGAPAARVADCLLDCATPACSQSLDADHATAQPALPPHARVFACPRPPAFTAQIQTLCLASALLWCTRGLVARVCAEAGRHFVFFHDVDRPGSATANKQHRAVAGGHRTTSYLQFCLCLDVDRPDASACDRYSRVGSRGHTGRGLQHGRDLRPRGLMWQHCNALSH